MPRTQPHIALAPHTPELGSRLTNQARGNPHALGADRAFALNKAPFLFPH